MPTNYIKKATFSSYTTWTLVRWLCPICVNLESDWVTGGRPSVDRVWVECFAQLVGTVLSLWDAAQLDSAGEDGEVVPTFVNLTDASIKMVRINSD